MERMDKEFLDEIRDAAREGAREGVKEIKLPRGGGILSTVLGKILSIVLVGGIIVIAINMVTSNLKNQVGFDNGVSDHDMALEDNGLLGYTAADFADAILGDQSKLCKLEVLNQQVSDAVTLTQTGLGNLKIFSKTQLITYHGTATYTVDLSKLSQSDFRLDDEKKEVTVYIPHATLEPINIQSDDIEFGDVNKGMLAFGDIKATPEEIAKVQTEAQNKMAQKLDEQNIIADADRFAKLVVWELFQPVINSVTEGYSLTVEFTDDGTAAETEAAETVAETATGK